VTRTLAADPVLNLRLFTAGTPASLAAVRAWMHVSTANDDGAWNVLVESLANREIEPIRATAAPSGVSVEGHGQRHRLVGTPAGLFDLSGALLGTQHTELGSELRAALSAFDGALYPRSPTVVMGILNVTPDSFSDGGRWDDPQAAVRRAVQMVEEGAHVIDIGGESTRPGAQEVPADEELRRVLPVVEALREETNALISVDTRKAAVAEPCLAAGADWINDVSGLTHDPALAGVVAAYPGTRLVLMHSRARPADERFSTHYDARGRPIYQDVVADTLRWLRGQIHVAMNAGVPSESLWIDPGFGFGKTPEQNVELLRRLREYTTCGLPVLVGTSRKSTLGRLAGDLPPEERLEATAASVASAITHGAAGVRVHDVKEMARVARVADALR
jgi:dihydropteroate synthase